MRKKRKRNEKKDSDNGSAQDMTPPQNDEPKAIEPEHPSPETNFSPAIEADFVLGSFLNDVIPKSFRRPPEELPQINVSGSDATDDDLAGDFDIDDISDSAIDAFLKKHLPALRSDVESRTTAKKDLQLSPTNLDKKDAGVAEPHPAPTDDAPFPETTTPLFHFHKDVNEIEPVSGSTLEILYEINKLRPQDDALKPESFYETIDRDAPRIRYQPETDEKSPGVDSAQLDSKAESAKPEANITQTSDEIFLGEPDAGHEHPVETEQSVEQTESQDSTFEEFFLTQTETPEPATESSTPVEETAEEHDAVFEELFLTQMETPEPATESSTPVEETAKEDDAVFEEFFLTKSETPEPATESSTPVEETAEEHDAVFEEVFLTKSQTPEPATESSTPVEETAKEHDAVFEELFLTQTETPEPATESSTPIEETAKEHDAVFEELFLTQTETPEPATGSSTPVEETAEERDATFEELFFHESDEHKNSLFDETVAGEKTADPHFETFDESLLHEFTLEKNEQNAATEQTDSLDSAGDISAGFEELLTDQPNDAITELTEEAPPAAETFGQKPPSLDNITLGELETAASEAFEQTEPAVTTESAKSPIEETPAEISQPGDSAKKEPAEPDEPFAETIFGESEPGGEESFESVFGLPPISEQTTTLFALTPPPQAFTPMEVEEIAAEPEPEPEPQPMPVNEMALLLGHAISLYREKKYDDAILELKQLLKINADFTIAYKILGNAYFKNKMYSDALASYEQYKRKQPDDLSVHENLGIIYSRLGILQLAIKEWQTLLLSQPERQDLERRIGRAKAILLEKEKPTPQPLDERVLLLNQGIQHYKSKDYEHAIDAFREALIRYSDNIEVYSFLGNAYFRNQMLAEATKAYEQVKRMDSTYVTAYENMAVIYYRQGDYVQALREWEKVLELSPTRLDVNEKIKKTIRKLRDAAAVNPTV
jgi:tetratricopeptide (TPR) repeat protein